MKMTAPRAALFLAPAFVPALVSAQVEDFTELDPIVVTAARTAQTADETLASITVITQEDIERKQAKDLIEVFRGLPGLEMSNSGGPGKATSLFLRGTSSDNTLILIDGMKIGSATFGGTNLQDIPVSQIARIEVVRGPRSSLYGSEAIGGVIQIFTRRGAFNQPLTPRVTTELGSYHTARLSAGLSVGAENSWLDIGLGYEKTDGFNATQTDSQTDDDGYINYNGSVSAAWQPMDHLGFKLNFLRSEGKSQFDGLSADLSKNVTQVASALTQISLTDYWASDISFGRSWDLSKNYRDETIFVEKFDTNRDFVQWKNEFYINSDQVVTLGIDYQNDKVEATQKYDKTSRDNTGFYGQYLGQFGKADTQVSLRHDDNEQYGTKATGNVAAGYGFDNGLRLFASYGTAFKAPTFNDLYFPFTVYNFGFGPYRYQGNPNLQPESSRSLEIGLTGNMKIARWGLSVYQTDIDNLIQVDEIGGINQPVNVNEARIRGMELWTSLDLADWVIDANLTLLDPRNRSQGANYNKLLNRRAEQTLRIDLDRQFGQVGLGGTLVTVGRRYDDASNNDSLDAYTLVGLRASYAFHRSVNVQASLENLFDENYETVKGFRQPGRAFYLTLNYQP